MIVAKKGPDIDNNRISDMPLIDTIEKGVQAELLMVDGNPLEKRRYSMIPKNTSADNEVRENLQEHNQLIRTENWRHKRYER